LETSAWLICRFVFAEKAVVVEPGVETDLRRTLVHKLTDKLAATTPNLAGTKKSDYLRDLCPNGKRTHSRTCDARCQVKDAFFNDRQFVNSLTARFPSGWELQVDGIASRPPCPAPSADGLMKTPAAGHPLTKGEGPSF
jgi:hypothetical protein